MSSSITPPPPLPPVPPALDVAVPDQLTDKSGHVDRVLIMLFAGMLIFTAMMFFAEWRFPNDGQIFQVVAGLITGFAGAFFGRMKPPASKDKS